MKQKRRRLKGIFQISPEEKAIKEKTKEQKKIKRFEMKTELLEKRKQNAIKKHEEYILLMKKIANSLETMNK